LTFSDAPYFSKLLDPHDASSRRRFTVMPIPGSVDDDGDPTRPVLPCTIAIVGSAGKVLDVTVDRPFSSWPSKYSITVNQLRSSFGAPLDPTKTTAQFAGVQYDEIGGATRPVASSGDFSNPQTSNGITVGVTPEQAAILGSYPIGPDGDYATDRGVASWKKRILRRLLSNRGGFASLPATYGLGPQQRIKKLFRKTDAVALAGEAEAQCLLDPETKAAKVTVVEVKGAPNVGYFRIQAKHVTGSSFEEDLPIPVSS
jgi:hypothetical protein